MFFHRYEREHPTEMVIHPLYPFGDLQFLMGDRHFERVRRITVPGLPCTLQVEQPQSWRSSLR